VKFFNHPLRCVRRKWNRCGGTRGDHSRRDQEHLSRRGRDPRTLSSPLPAGTRARDRRRMPSELRLRASGEVRPILLGLLTPGYKARDMSIADPHRRPDRDREKSDANASTTGRAVGPDPLAPGARARVQAMAEFTARGKAFRFPKGQSGNPDGQSRFYHACRKLAREASREMMAGLIDLAKNAVDERVRSVGCVSFRAC
jgi:hypothetical protein